LPLLAVQRITMEKQRLNVLETKQKKLQQNVQPAVNVVNNRIFFPSCYIDRSYSVEVFSIE
jgi:hypothetical protein